MLATAAASVRPRAHARAFADVTLDDSRTAVGQQVTTMATTVVVVSSASPQAADESARARARAHEASAVSGAQLRPKKNGVAVSRCARARARPARTAHAFA